MMVRYGNGNEPIKGGGGPNKATTGNYVYEQTYASSWDSVLQEKEAPANTCTESSFDKGSAQAAKGTPALEEDALVGNNDDDASEHKEEETESSSWNLKNRASKPQQQEEEESTLERTQHTSSSRSSCGWRTTTRTLNTHWHSSGTRT
jgi:hypothetical protein